MSGYTHCACRDCMDTTVSSDTSKPELCSACQEADCLPCEARSGDDCITPTAHECQRDDAYEEA